MNKIILFLRRVKRARIGHSLHLLGAWDSLLRSRLLQPILTQLPFRVDDVRMTLPPRYWGQYILNEYEPVTRRSLDEHLHPGMTVVDVGAHVGFFASKAARLVGPSGRVIALEPSSENLPFLRRNTARNGSGNVVVHGIAASGKTGRREFNITGSSDSNGFYAHPLTHTVKTLEVETVRLDDLVDGPVDAVKIDVEGAELEVLDGMERLLRESRQITLWVEWNPSCQREAGRPSNLLPHRLTELGFDVVALDDHAGRVRPMSEVFAEVEAGVPDWWFVNLLALREK